MYLEMSKITGDQFHLRPGDNARMASEECFTFLTGWQPLCCARNLGLCHCQIINYKLCSTGIYSFPFFNFLCSRELGGCNSSQQGKSITNQPLKFNNHSLFYSFILHKIQQFSNFFTRITVRLGYLCCFQGLLLFICLIVHKLM